MPACMLVCLALALKLLTGCRTAAASCMQSLKVSKACLPHLSLLVCIFTSCAGLEPLTECRTRIASCTQRAAVLGPRQIYHICMYMPCWALTGCRKSPFFLHLRFADHSRLFQIFPTPTVHTMTDACASSRARPAHIKLFGHEKAFQVASTFEHMASAQSVRHVHRSTQLSGC